jgi:hypothetical protein
MATWSCTKLLNAYNKISRRIAPTKTTALMVLTLGLVDNITSPLQHAINGGVVYTQTSLEIIIRIFFVFCGIYGLIGNGRSARIRATVVSLPLLYLLAFYTMMWIQYNNDAFLALMCLTGIPGVWILLFGDTYATK